MGMNFNFHDIITLRITKEKERFLERFFSHLDMEYDYFKVDKVELPTITMIIGDFYPNIKILDCTVVDQKYHIAENYIYFKDSYKLAKWEAEISGFETGRILIRIKSNLLGYLFFDGYILEPLIRYAMLQKGYLVIHAAGISVHGNAVIMPVRSGEGKTTWALEEVGLHNADFLGDDYVIIKNKKAYAFPSFIHVFNYHLNKQFYEENLSFWQKAEIKLKYMIYKSTFGYAKFFSNFFLTDIFPNAKIANDVNVTFWRDSEGILKENLVDKIFWNMVIETYPFNHYLEAYAYVYPKSKLANFWKDFYKKLKKEMK